MTEQRSGLSFLGNAFLGISLLVPFMVLAGILWVHATPRTPVALEVTTTQTAIRQGETTQLNAILRYDDGSTKNVTSGWYGTYYMGHTT